MNQKVIRIIDNRIRKLEGYIFLGNVPQRGDENMTLFLIHNLLTFYRLAGQEEYVRAIEHLHDCFDPDELHDLIAPTVLKYVIKNNVY